MSTTVQSIQMKLRHLSKQKNRNHQLTLTRYFQERLLFRLSISSYKHHFFLKGGALVYALEREASRPTLDLDLLAQRIPSESQLLREIFQNICSLEYPADGVLYETSNIETTEIIKEGKYGGIRLKIMVKLGNIQQRMQVDIGFGDLIIPKPVEMDYPTLLEMETPNILAYSVESLVAEKFEAMIDLSELNSRMKDFYDVYRILNTEKFDRENLETAIVATFQKRETATSKGHPLFTLDFVVNERRNAQWKAFLAKANLKETIAFVQVMEMIKTKLEPIYKKIVAQ